MDESCYRIKTFQMDNGIRMPAIGLGTYRLNNYDLLFQTMDLALGTGYRLFDTAATYGNEKQLGEALNALLPRHSISREEIFITTKLSPSSSAKSVTRAFNRSLSNLGLDYIDMYLINFPGYPRHNIKSAENQKRRRETWLAIVKLFDEGKVNAIGVSNFTADHLKELADIMAFGPLVNQIEYHPFYVDTKTIQYCIANNILIQAYSSFGGMSLKNNELMENPVVKKIAHKYNATCSQVLLAWALQRGIAVIPKSTNAFHMHENLMVNIELAPKDMRSLDALGAKNKKYSWDPANIA